MLLFLIIRDYPYLMRILRSWTIGDLSWRGAFIKNYPLIGLSICERTYDGVKIRWYLWMNRKELCHGREEQDIRMERLWSIMRSESSDLKKIWKIILIGVAPNREM